ncbi:hypothetical protein Hypma_016412 [Hypsizygus marmoreus]|uniref:Amine oxidase domain-containing protein n=1 Tax=Hypsizygus marmoreus TaxID=39966 RepID=A0A369J5U7_HYPMA|nr:hypothetical protein Hypma_016412 [Hypsizygus marmoreus]
MKVAIVGSGVSGLAATWLLNEHSDHTVHLYEADARPGGHAHTVSYTPPGSRNGDSVDVDTGFIVFNPSTYPNFLRLLRMHGSTRGLVTPTEMTFSVSRDGGAFEWAGKNLFAVFCQLSNLFDLGMWRMLWDVVRFNATAGKVLLEKQDGVDEEESIGQYLDREGYSLAFRDNYLIPMTAAIWSTPPDKCAMDFPARTLIQFLHNHHLLQITGKPSWLTLKGGSKAYVNQILSTLPHSQLHLSTPVASITRLNASSKVLLKTEGGANEEYDHVILACHSDDAVRILRAGAGESGSGITPDEERILGAFRWSRNEVVLHSDVRLMPKRRQAWSCWNYLTNSTIDERGRRKDNADTFFSLNRTYGMNDLQHIPESRYGPVLVTLNPPFQPLDELTRGRWRYDHPVLDAKAVRAQKELPTIQGKHGVSFAGAYLRYGFHEDGFTSGLVAAAALSSLSASKTENENENEKGTVRPPFPIEYAAQEVKWTVGRRVLAGVFDLVQDVGGWVWVVVGVLLVLFGKAG